MKRSEIIDLLEQDLLAPGMALIDETTGVKITVVAPDRLMLECGELCEIWRRSILLDPTMFDQ